MAHALKTDQIDVKLVSKYCKQLGVKVPKGQDAATLLQAHFRSAAEAGKISPVQCDRCDGISDAVLTECPFCGDAGELEMEVAAAPEAPQDAAQDEPQDEDDDAIDAEVIEAPAPAQKAPKGKKAPPVAEATTKNPPKAVKVAKADKVPAAALAAPTKAELAKVEQLDEQCAKVKTLTVTAAQSLWDVGQALSKIHDKDLWKMRRVNNVPVHVSFRRFVQDELGISHTYAYQMMEVAKEFTRKEVEQIGVNKLRLVLQAPPEKRAQALEAAAGGASNQQLAAMGRPPAPRNAVTVAMMLGTQTLPAYSRTRKDGESPALARKVQEDPWTLIPLENGAQIKVVLTSSPTGELSFVVEVTRDTAAKVA